MTNQYPIFASVALSLFSAQALAHAGHDHGASHAWLVHLIWIAPTLVAGYLCLRAYRIHQAKQEFSQ